MASSHCREELFAQTGSPPPLADTNKKAYFWVSSTRLLPQLRTIACHLASSHRRSPRIYDMKEIYFSLSSTNCGAPLLTFNSLLNLREKQRFNPSEVENRAAPYAPAQPLMKRTVTWLPAYEISLTLRSWDGLVSLRGCNCVTRHAAMLCQIIRIFFFLGKKKSLNKGDFHSKLLDTWL